MQTIEERQMSKTLATIFRIIAKPLAVFFVILFVLATILVLPLYNFERTLLNAGTYKRILVSHDVYEQVPTLAAGNMDAIKAFLTKPDGIASENMGFVKDLTAKDMQTLVAALLPPEEARTMVENMLDQVFAYINGETDTAGLSLVVLKAHITGQSGGNLILQLLSVLPPCSEEQLVQIHSTNAGDTPIPPVLCSPQPADLGQQISLWQAQLETLAAGIPDELTLLKTSSEPPSLGPLGNDSIAKLNTLRMEIRFSPILPLGLLALVTLFGIRSLKDWLRWWGISLLISGLICTVFGLAILPLASWAWINFILPQFPSGASADLTSLARNLVGFVGQAVSSPIILQAIIISVLGLAMTIGSFFGGKNHAQPGPLASPVETK
jgi:hypothetical protein